MDTRTKILDSTIEVLSLRPRSSMADIAQAAGVTRVTVNRHFGNRDVLVNETMNHCIDIYNQGIERAQKKPHKNSLEVLKHVLDEMIPLYHHSQMLLRFVEWRSGGKQEKELMKISATLHTVVEEAKKDGYLRSDVDSEWMMNFFSYTSIAIGKMLSLGAVAPRDAGKIAAESFLNGCATSTKAKRKKS